MEGWGTQAGWRSGHGRTEGRRTMGHEPGSRPKPKTGELKMGKREDQQNLEPVDRIMVKEQGVVCTR